MNVDNLDVLIIVFFILAIVVIAGCFVVGARFNAPKADRNTDSDFYSVKPANIINPATGLQMIGSARSGIDVAGNSYGNNNDLSVNHFI